MINTDIALKVFKMENVNQIINLPTEEFSILENLSKKENMTTDQYLSELIHDKVSNGVLSKSEMWVTTLEMVMAQLNEHKDISDLRNEIAGDLLVAKISLDFDRTGKVDDKKIKSYISELF